MPLREVHEVWIPEDVFKRLLNGEKVFATPSLVDWQPPDLIKAVETDAQGLATGRVCWRRIKSMRRFTSTCEGELGDL